MLSESITKVHCGNAWLLLTPQLRIRRLAGVTWESRTNLGAIGIELSLEGIYLHRGYYIGVINVGPEQQESSRAQGR